MNVIPATCKRLGIDTNHAESLIASMLSTASRDSVIQMRAYIEARLRVEAMVDAQCPGSFMDSRKSLEKRLVFKMSHILDSAAIDFREQRKNDAEQLRKIIRSKKQIPKSLLPALMNAFPCIIAGIRELGEFLPLEPDLFDIAIIDEASQVSIAQAFPVLIRAKKIVVLGDQQQYSNVKAHNASTQVNNALFSTVKETYAKELTSLPPEEQTVFMDHVSNFNIKTSILDFVKHIANYSCSLKKHFRGYLELIGYSNETFYQKSLQVMKIRGKPLNEVIQVYSVVVPPGPELVKNTNPAEAEFALAVLEDLEKSSYTGSVGIITPFTNQQKMIANMVFSSPSFNHYRQAFDIRVMTFDTSQGQERDIIIYSMVEKPGEDTLKYIFPLRLSHLAEEDEGTIKAQRLNVGLSRAKETVKFIISKPIEQFTGEIGNALRFFIQSLQGPDFIELARRTDQQSPREAEVLHWIMQTQFYLENKDKVEIIPQFELGRYLRQLDPTVKIPAYRTDFLLLCRWSLDDIVRLVLEYDGFEHHFKDDDFISEANSQFFQIEGDLERKKAIESYGYAFLPLNKFVLRGDPIAYLNKQLARLCKKKVPTMTF